MPIAGESMTKVISTFTLPLRVLPARRRHPTEHAGHNRRCLDLLCLPTRERFGQHLADRPGPFGPNPLGGIFETPGRRRILPGLVFLDAIPDGRHDLARLRALSPCPPASDSARASVTPIILAIKLVMRMLFISIFPLAPRNLHGNGTPSNFVTFGEALGSVGPRQGRPTT